MKTIEQLIDAGELCAMTVWMLCDGRVQVNTKAKDSDGWSVHYGNTPGEALRAALEFRSTLVKKAPPSFF